MSVIEVKTMEDLDKHLKDAGSKLVVVDFFATWCGPCRMIAPKIAGLATQYVDVVFLKVDCDECEEASTKYNISAMPTFVFLKNSVAVETIVGANIDLIQRKVAEYADASQVTK